MAESNRRVISVSELNRSARRLLESEFPLLYVEGEISNLARPRSGHWYFTLKDDKAQVRCVMFQSRNQRVRFAPRDGQQIIVRGRISLYEGRGEFQINAESLEDSGDGALRHAFEQLREALQKEGLFDEARKQPLPKMPRHIAIITSPAGAAIHDVITVTRRRFPAVRLGILPVQVQGEGSVEQIVNALGFANGFTEEPFDLILLTRGGGSPEDLWSFNTEPVARAIAASRLPVVSAIGHESDVCIADFVADLRAPTPSGAAELITPDGATWRDEFAELGRRLGQAMAQRLERNKGEVNHLSRRLRHPSSRLGDLSQRLDELERRLIGRMWRYFRSLDFSNLTRRFQLAMQTRLANYGTRLHSQKLASPAGVIAGKSAQVGRLGEKLANAAFAGQRAKAARLSTLAAKLHALSPLATLQRGYAIVSTLPDNHVLTDAAEVQPGDEVRARLQRGEIRARVTSGESA